MMTVMSSFKYFSLLGIGLGVAVWIQSIAYSMIFPVFKSLFYIDLKVRKGEIEFKLL